MTTDDTSRVRKDIGQFVSFALGYAVVLALGYLLMRKINLTLSIGEMAKFSYVMSMTGLVAGAFYLAPAQVYLRFNDNHEVSSRLRLKLLPVFLLSFGIAAFAIFAVTKSWFAVLYAFMPFFFERVYVFRAQMRSMVFNISKVLEISIPLMVIYGSTFLDAHMEWLDSNGMLGLYGIGYMAGLLFPLRMKDSKSPPLRVLFKFMWPIMLTTLLVSFTENFSVVAIEHIVGNEATAYFGVAVRNLIFMRAIIQLLLTFYPVVYFREMKLCHHSVVWWYRTGVLTIAGLFALCMAIGAQLLYRCVGAQVYVGYSMVFVLLVIGIFFDFMADVFGLYFQYEICAWKQTIAKAMAVTMMSVSFLAMYFLGVKSLVLFASACLLSSIVNFLITFIWARVSERLNKDASPI